MPEERLGKAALDLTTNLSEFRADVHAAKESAEELRRALESIAAVADLSERQLNRVGLTGRAAVESETSASAILQGVRGISDEAREAARHLDDVKLDEENAATSAVAASGIKHELKGVTGEANEARRALESVRLVGGVPGRSGVGVGPFGSGFGRIGLLGAAVGAGVLTAPAAGPALGGLGAVLPSLGVGAAGTIGTLVLALQGVGKAIGGDKKAFDDLQPSAQRFVLTVRSLDGALDRLRETAGQNMFPGLERGLREALSPGTWQAVTVAVGEFGKAVGGAGEQWGRYLGSPEFQKLLGPLAADGARNLGVLTQAVISLFDALGVVGRAAIPLTDWMNDGIAKGARLADVWLRDKEATGALGHAMDEAQVSIRLVGGLIGALLNAVGALGQALYPVSKVAVKDLTDGLNALAGIIRRNQETIRDVVGGALGAFVNMIEATSAAVRTLWPLLAKVVDEVGGWTTAFEILIGLKIASIVNSWAGAFMRLAGAEALGAAEARSAGLLTNLTRLKLLGPIVIAVTVDEVVRKITGSGWDLSQGTTPDNYVVGTFRGQRVAAVMGSPLGRDIAALNAGKKLTQAQITELTRGIKSGNVTTGSAAAGVKTAGQYTPLYGNDLTSYIMAAAAQNGLDPQAVLAVATAEGGFSGAVGDKGTSFGPFQLHRGGALPKGQGYGFAQSKSGIDYALKQMAKSATGLKGMDAVRAIVKNFERPADGGAGDIRRASAYLASLGVAASAGGAGSPWGTPPPFDKNLGPKPAKPPLIPAQASHFADVASTYANLAKQLDNTGATAKNYLANELIALTKEWQILQAKAATSTGKSKVALGKAITGIENKMRDVGTQISEAIVTVGVALLPQALKARLAQITAKFQADSAYASVLTGDTADRYATIVRDDLYGEQRVLEQEVAVLQRRLASSKGKQRTAVAKELADVQSQLDDVQQQIVASLQGNVQTLQQRASSLFSSVVSQMDAAFERQTQALIDQAASRFFQNGAQTPEELAYQAMLDASRQKQLQDALTAAQTPEERAAAQEAIDEDRAAAAATRSRKQADEAYAAEVKRIQAERAAAEADMNAKLAALSDAFENGTGDMSALSAIAAAYGIQIDTVTIPDFDNLSAATISLADAFKDLADYIARITGTSPSSVPSRTTSSSDAAAAAAALMAGGSVTAAYRALIGQGVDTATAQYLAKQMSIPLLDTGGEVLKTGMAVVHRGEVYSGVGGGSLRSGGDIILMVDGREIGRIAADALVRDQSAGRTAAAGVKPHLDRQVAVTTG